MMHIQPLRILIAAIISAVAIFMWGFVFWTVLPNPSFGHRYLKKEQVNSLASELKKLDSGTYVHPSPIPYEGESTEQMMERHKSGPVYSLSVVSTGMDMASPRTMVQGFIHAFAACVIAGVLVSIVGSGFCCYSHRVFFVFMLGLFATTWVDVGETIWWFRSCGVTTWHAIYHIVAWLLAGLIIGAIVKNGSGTVKER
jgi:hypothetical protein